MDKETSVEDCIDDDLCATKLSKTEIVKFKRLAERKELPNLKMIGVYEAWGILQEELEKEGVEDAYEISRGKGTKIVIINSGGDNGHPEIKSSLSGVFDYHKNNKDISDKNGHGTQILGIIAGQSLGIAPFSECCILKVRDDKIGFSPVKNVKLALTDSMYKNADIINMSIGKLEYDGDLEKLCKLAYYKKGKLIISAAGKTVIGPAFPASYEGVISVGAINLEGKHRESSNIWPTIDISAPGEEVFTAYINRWGDYNLAYALCSGSSMAAPHVTAVLSLAISYLRHKKIKLSPKELEVLMKSSASPPEYKKEEIEKMIRDYRFDMIHNKIEISQFVRYMYGAGIIRADNFIKQIISYIKC